MGRFSQTNSLDEVISDTGEALLTSVVQTAPKLTAYHYRDINSNYTTGANDLIVYEEEAVNQQITNLLSTLLGSDHFEPTHGSLLEFRLWETISPKNAFLLRGDTIDAVGTWLSDRVEVIVSATRVSPVFGVEGEGYTIDMPYFIKRIRQVGNYSAFLRR